MVTWPWTNMSTSFRTILRLWSDNCQHDAKSSERGRSNGQIQSRFIEKIVWYSYIARTALVRYSSHTRYHSVARCLKVGLGGKWMTPTIRQPGFDLRGQTASGLTKACTAIEIWNTYAQPILQRCWFRPLTQNMSVFRVPVCGVN